MNLEGITLKLLLHEENKERALEYYSKLRPEFFSKSFRSILRHVRGFYDDVGYVPSLGELQTYRNRDSKIQIALSSLELIKVEDIDIELAISSLEDQFAQNTVLDLITKYLETLPLMDKDEIQDKIASIPLKLEETMDNTNAVFSIKDLPIFQTPEHLNKTKVLSGISDEWDREAGGYYRQELVLLGGKRGSGKSIVCANLVANQHKQGYVSIYFTIEMTAAETMQRIVCILAGVELSHLRKGEMTLEDNQKVAKTLISLFEDADPLYDKYFKNKTNPDVLAFQEELYKHYQEKDKGRIIIVDDRSLSTATLDTKLAMYKGRYKDELALVTVDYVNQMTLDGDEVDMYDWKAQVTISKTLKNLARKYDLCLVSPYQMDDAGQARFAKGILDAADVAQLIRVEDKTDGSAYVTFETTKARNTSDAGRHKVSIDWRTLIIDPTPVIVAEAEEVIGKSSDEAIADL